MSQVNRRGSLVQQLSTNQGLQIDVAEQLGILPEGVPMVLRVLKRGTGWPLNLDELLDQTVEEYLVRMKRMREAGSTVNRLISTNEIIRSAEAVKIRARRACEKSKKLVSIEHSGDGEGYTMRTTDHLLQAMAVRAYESLSLHDRDLLLLGDDGSELAEYLGAKASGQNWQFEKKESQDKAISRARWRWLRAVEREMQNSDH